MKGRKCLSSRGDIDRATKAGLPIDVTAVGPWQPERAISTICLVSASLELAVRSHKSGLLAGLVLMSSATSAVAAPSKTIAPDDPMVANSWEIGPVIQGRNYSLNMPLTPVPHANGGWYFDIPSPDAAAGHVHYVTFKHGSLTGKTRIILRYRLEMAEGVQIVPTKAQPGTFAPILTLYFQRRNDDWSGVGKFEAYRWWATFASVTPLTAGERELSVPLDGAWTAVQSSNAITNAKVFRDALRDADRVGFTFGGGDGYGHGVYATGPARFVVTSFQILGDTDFGTRGAPEN